MNKSLLIALIASLAAGSAEAGDYQLKSRSQFTPVEAGHNPFWPIGWVKPAPGQKSANNAPAVAIRSEDFFVSSISIMDGARYAVVNGKVYGEGEAIPALINNQKVKVQLVSIKDGGITLGFGGQGVSVTLKRKEDAALNRPPVPEASERPEDS